MMPSSRLACLPNFGTGNETEGLDSEVECSFCTQYCNDDFAADLMETGDRFKKPLHETTCERNDGGTYFRACCHIL